MVEVKNFSYKFSKPASRSRNIPNSGVYDHFTLYKGFMAEILAGGSLSSVMQWLAVRSFLLAAIHPFHLNNVTKFIFKPFPPYARIII